MTAIAHQHDWSHTNGGLVCTLPPCTAQLSHAEIRSNATPAVGRQQQDFNDLFNTAWKKIH